MTIEELIKLADLLDSQGEHEAANEVDKLIAEAAGATPWDEGDDPTMKMEDEPTMKELGVGEILEPGEYESEHKETMTMEPTGPEVQGVDALKAAFDAFLESPRRFENVHKLKKLMDDYILANVPDKSASLGEVFEKLADVADSLDKAGALDEANMIDSFIEKHAEDYDEDRKEEADTEQSKRYDSKHHHNLQVREPKRDQERVDREGRKEHHVKTYKSVEATSLQTRYCPEHIGTQMGRVGEATYQCPLDGQVFNWEAGWTDFDGNQHPGGSVAAQTPDSTGYAIPHRIFDSREKVLNVVN